MMSVLETDGMAIYVGTDQVLFVLSNSRVCPRCGRSAVIFRYTEGKSECVGCHGSDSDSQYKPLLTGAVAAM